MSLENRQWGATRIHGELKMIGFSVCETTVRKYMIPRRNRPSGSWKGFLRSHLEEIAAIDLFGVETLAFERLYAVVVLHLNRRRILHVEVADRPTAEWLANQIAWAFPWDEAPRWLIRDNDGAYGLKFRRRVSSMNIRARPTTPRSPWQNGYVERLIGSIRRECLKDWIPLNAAHLRRRLRAYADYYNNDRTHLSLDKDAPNPRAVELHGAIVSRPILGGLHHRYRRIPPVDGRD